MDSLNIISSAARQIKLGLASVSKLGKLIKNKARLNRFETTGMLTVKEIFIFKSVAEFYRHSRKRDIAILSGLMSVIVIAVIMLVVQNVSYSVRLAKQQSLVDELESLNKQLTKSSDKPVYNDNKKMALLAKVRAQERLMAKLQANLSQEDLSALYKDPLGIDIHIAMQGFGERDYVVPEMFIGRVKKYLNSWKRGGSFVKRAIRNKKIHGPMILRELEKAKLPSAFLYLAMHESSLDSTIVSPAGARGLWQFIPATGRSYGLNVPAIWRKLPSHRDERTSPLMSTQAAIKFLKVLLREFGTVPLAMASYNAGEGRIRRDLKRLDDPLNDRDFWYIYRTGTLARETQEYLPKIVATMLMDQFPGKYGRK